MLETEYRIEYYQDAGGGVPFRDWLDGLRDVAAVARIRIRLNRVRLGNFGVIRALGDGVSELKIDHGPGYRVYYAMCGKTVVLLLVGGDKSSQRRDIAAAKRYWREYQEGE
ncbi:MAG TPA: type II toxin-antitoxin system RelE/ParE family toxin [Geobacteraceae bacterium]